jgi:predicted negative regulator of RcsB-dependent stress response
MAVIHFKYKHDYLSALECQLLKHKIVLKSSTPQPEDQNFTIDQRKTYTAISHLELAEIYIALYHYDLATAHLKTAMDINEERNSKYILDVSATYYENFANIYPPGKK